MYKAAILDMDGTILDTIEDLRASVNYTLRTLGFPERDLDTFRPFIGNGLYLLLRRSLPEGHQDDETVARAAEIYNPYYAAHAADLTTTYEGVSEALAAMRGEGMKLAVLSNKPHEFTVTLAERYFPGIFDIACGQRPEVPKKPDPAAVFAILEQLGVAAEDCVYIGDSDVDMMTARNAGVDSVGVTWGYCPKNKLEAVGSTVIIDKASALLDFVVDKRKAAEYTTY